MSETEFLGYAVLAIVTLGSFIAVVMKIIQPVNDLRVVIQKLNDIIETMKRDNETQTKQISKNTENINNLDNRVGKLETRFEFYHKE